MDYLSLIIQFIIFPGILFTAVIGLITTWIDRKVTAKVQMRVGPPFLQPFYDIIKYMIKETIVPAGGSKFIFLSAPIIGFTGVSAASLIIWRANIFPGQTFMGDLIVVLYLLTFPSLSIILGSFASRNPIASLGGSREMKLILAYELPFLLACLIPVIQNYNIRLGEIIVNGPSAFYSISGTIALIVAIICIQAKLTLVPFDSPEAETEITGGAYIEYSGPPLGLFKLTRAMMMFTMPMFIITVFWGGINFSGGIVPVIYGILKYITIVVIIILIRNTAPRLRIDQAVKFFWTTMLGASIAAVLFAVVGL